MITAVDVIVSSDRAAGDHVENDVPEAGDRGRGLGNRLTDSRRPYPRANDVDQNHDHGRCREREQ